MWLTDRTPSLDDPLPACLAGEEGFGDCRRLAQKLLHLPDELAGVAKSSSYFLSVPKRRYYGCVLHFEIKDSKIWFQHNGTEREIVDELMDKGVPREDIVLGFHAPYLRKYTEFAAG